MLLSSLHVLENLGRGFLLLLVKYENYQSKRKNLSLTLQSSSKTNEQIIRVSSSVKQISSLVSEGTDSMSATDRYFEEIVKDMSNSKEQNKKIEHELQAISQVMKGIQDDSSQMALTADNLQLELNR